MYKYKNKLTVKKGMKRYVARRSRIIRNNVDVDGGMIKCEVYDQITIKRDSLDSYINLQQRSYQDMPRVYKEADIFVLPSKKTKTWEEQYGMVLIEAMASGLPILASKSGAIPEVVGDTAILFEEGNVEQLRSALLKADDKKVREQYSRKALERSKKYFDAEEVSKSIYRFYCKTLGL